MEGRMLCLCRDLWCFLVMALHYTIESKESPGGNRSMPSSYFPSLHGAVDSENNNQLGPQVRVWKFCSVTMQDESQLECPVSGLESPFLKWLKDLFCTWETCSEKLCSWPVGSQMLYLCICLKCTSKGRKCLYWFSLCWLRGRRQLFSPKAGHRWGLWLSYGC